jgi:hypothetical protein
MEADLIGAHDFDRSHPPLQQRGIGSFMARKAEWHIFKPPAVPPAFSISPPQRVTGRASAWEHRRAHPSPSRARLHPAALVRYIAAQPSIGIDEGTWHTRWVSR